MIALPHKRHKSSQTCLPEITQRICDVISETYDLDEISRIEYVDIMIVLVANEDLMIYGEIACDMRIHGTLYSVACTLYGPTVSHNNKCWICYRCTLEEKSCQL